MIPYLRLATLLLCSTAAVAQDAGDELLKDISKDGPTLGTRTLAVYVTPSGANIGSITIEVAQGPKKKTYQAEGVLSMRFGPMQETRTLELVLDSTFSILSGTLTKQTESTRVRRLTRKGKNLTLTQDIDGETSELSLKHGGTLHGAVVAQFLLAEALAGHDSGEWTLQRIEWGSTAEESVLQSQPVSIAAEQTFSWQGTDTPVTSVTFPGKEDSEAMTFHVNESGQVIGMTPPEGTPLVVVPCEGEACGQSLPVPEAHKPILATLVTLFEVFNGLKPTDALDDILDWQSLMEGVMVDDPTVAVLTLDEFKASMKEGLTKSPDEPVDPTARDMIDATVRMSSVQIQGDQAIVMFPGTEQGLEVVLVDGRWLLRSLPR